MKLTTRHRIAGALGIAALALAACGDSSSSSSGGGGSSSSSSGSGLATQDPGAVAGGTLNIGLVQEPTSFLAAGITDSMTFSYAADAPVVEGLLWYRSTDETANAKTQADFYQPDLATEVPTVANGDVKLSGCSAQGAAMCVTWKLRDGVKWQDGTTFSSKDVCSTADFFYLKYDAKGQKNPTAILSTSGWDQMTSCVADSPLQATFNFKTVFGPYLSLGTGVYGILPDKLLQAAFSANADLEKTSQTVDLTVGSGNPAAYKGSDTLDKMIDGTGPFVFQSYVPQKSITYVQNKNYWNKAHMPHIDKLVFQIQSDVQSQLNAVKAGELDFGLDYRLAKLNDLTTVAQNGKIAIETIPESGSEKIDMNVCAQYKKCDPDARQPAALADPAFRHALIEGINRKAIVDKIALGKTVIPLDSWLYLGAEYAKSTTVTTTAYDVSRAKSDLDAAGYAVSPSCNGGRADKTGACINLQFTTTAGNPAREQAQIAIQQDLQAIGVQTTISNVKAGKLFGSFTDGGLLYTHQFDLAMYTNTMSSPAEPDSYWPGYLSSQIPTKGNSGQGQNDTGLADPVVDQAMNDGRGSVDLAKRAAAYQAAETQLAKDLVEIPLYQQVTVNSYSTKLKGLARNDLVWTYNAYDWYCTGGNCQA